MGQPAWISAYRVLFALLALAAIAFQFYRSCIDGAFSEVSFFSFFTIQSNLFALVVMLWTVLAGQRSSRPPRTVDLIRGAATFYLTVTFVVYGLLLAGYQEELQTTTPWVDTVLHRVFPLVLMLDWLLAPPRTRLAWREALIWLVYPLVYVTYSLIRGPIVDWYPYPFLDPSSPGGYATVAVYCLAIAVAGVVFTWVIVTLGTRLRLAVNSPAPAA